MTVVSGTVHWMIRGADGIAEELQSKIEINEMSNTIDHLLAAEV
jgi:hypothetical protein